MKMMVVMKKMKVIMRVIVMMVMVKIMMKMMRVRMMMIILFTQITAEETEPPQPHRSLIYTND